MKHLELKKDFYWTGIIDKNLRVFDIIMETEYGTTYNSYIMMAGDKTVLFETAKAKFVDEYIDKLNEIADASCIDYLVVSHTEPDHAGSVERLLDLNPGMKIVGTSCAISFLKEIVNRDFVAIPAKDKEEMVIGNKTLQFFFLPNLHWPDTMYTYIKEEKFLVTCDSFGAHYAFDDVLVSKVTDQAAYQSALKYYFDNILGPFKPFMRTALKVVRGLDIEMICTGHGPVLDAGLDKLLDTYDDWCADKNPNPKKTVIIPYVSAYGYTKELAGEIEKGIKDSGEIDVRSYDLVEADKNKVLEEISYADGLLLGSPTILGEALQPILELTSHMYPTTHGGKLAAAFGSYGWSGEAVPHLTERLEQIRMKVVEGFKVRFKPSENQLLDAYDYGFNFGCKLLEKEAPKKKGRSELVKCLVCGEIFDSSIEICPVCGVGKENFVPVVVEEVEYTNDTNNTYVILGNGAAGLGAAKAIRERDKTGIIKMITNEKYKAYNRPMLTKTIMAELDEDQVAVMKPGWYQDNNIDQQLSKEVVEIRESKKELLIEGGEKVHYDKLIYAVGAECFVPPIPGAKKEQVVAIRRLDDTKKIADLLPVIKNVVVIGGGVLGLEAAWEMKKARCEVTVLEMAPQLMGRQLDKEAGDILGTIAKANGIDILTGVKISEITGEDKVTGVKLDDGTEFAADLVIISCGIRANVALANTAGIKTDPAVVVNEKMETNVRDIYACGDCAEYDGVNYALWAEAAEQGRIAGANATGDEVEYETISAALNFHGMNTALFALGDNGKNAKFVYKTLEFKDLAKKRYKKLYFKNNRLCGVILIGDVSEMGELTQALDRGDSYQKITK